jgi:hypothetical protein
MIVFLEDLLRRPPAREQIDDELDSDPRPFDDWLADKHLRVHADAIMPVHRRSLSPQSGAFAHSQHSALRWFSAIAHPAGSRLANGLAPLLHALLSA